MKLFMFINLLFCLITLNANAHDRNEREHEEHERTKLALNADNVFWELIHGEDYQGFNTVMETLAKAQAADPHDVYTSAHIGWTNFWAVSEGVRSGVVDATKALQYLQTAEQAFSWASELAPNEPRILGFLGYARLTLGNATQNVELILQGQSDVARSIELWPEWAYFGAAYGLDAHAPYDSPQFQQALAYYWANLDVCANTPVDRQYPDWSLYLELETLEGPDRACWNSWIAPYNLQGFFLVMGDAMVKAGNIEVAITIYNNAKLANNYSSWPFRELLERRISNINDNVDNFRHTAFPYQPADPETSLLVNTNISCAICHSGNADKYFEQPEWVGEDANEYLVPFE
jgi:tetratricopeptide (TPR) repeat protein